MNEKIIKRAVKRHMATIITPGETEEDLLQEARIIYLEAEKTFDRSRGGSFDAYVIVKLRQGLIDHARKRMKRRLIAMRQQRSALEKEGLGPDAICERLGWSHKQYLQSCSVVEGLACDPTAKEVVSSEGFEHLIRGLGLIEVIILTLYFQYDNNMREIAKVLRISESAVSQRMSKALTIIRERL